MSADRIDHTALVVRDLDEALARYRVLLGVEPSSRHIVPDQRVEVAFLPLGSTQLELVQPLDDTSGVARFVDRRGEGLHHIGVQVDDIAAELVRLRAEGVELIDETPRPGIHGLIAFLHPRGAGGVLIELVQHNEDIV